MWNCEAQTYFKLESSSSNTLELYFSAEWFVCQLHRKHEDRRAKTLLTTRRTVFHIQAPWHWQWNFMLFFRSFSRRLFNHRDGLLRIFCIIKHWAMIRPGIGRKIVSLWPFVAALDVSENILISLLCSSFRCLFFCVCLWTDESVRKCSTLSSVEAISAWRQQWNKEKT